jgi:CCR4-NOT transcription complex subunit 2
VQLRNAMDKGSANSGGDGSGLMDQFGLMGLLNVIRMTDPDLTMLALGTDLTTLGLNLNSSDSLHKTFGSPWSDAPLSPEPDFKVHSFIPVSFCYHHPLH